MYYSFVQYLWHFQFWCNITIVFGHIKSKKIYSDIFAHWKLHKQISEYRLYSNICYKVNALPCEDMQTHAKATENDSKFYFSPLTRRKNLNYTEACIVTKSILFILIYASMQIWEVFKLWKELTFWNPHLKVLKYTNSSDTQKDCKW